LGEIFREFLNLFRGDEPPIRKIMRLFLVLAFVVGSVVVLESAMGLVTIGRLERHVNLLKELYALAEKGLGSHEQLVLIDNLYNKAVRDLDQYNPDLLQIAQRHFPNLTHVSWIEVVPAALTWILIGLMTLHTTKGGFLQKSTGCAFISGLGLAIGYVIAALISTPNDLVAILLSFCGGNLSLVLLVVIAIALTQRNQPVSKEENSPDSPIN